MCSEGARAFPETPRADKRLRCNSVHVLGMRHAARDTPPCRHACAGSAAAPLGGEHPLWSSELPGAEVPPWRCQGLAALAVNPPAGSLPAFVRGLQPVPEPIQPRGPSEHGHPQPCSCPGLPPRLPPWLELRRASVGAVGLGPPGGCSVPSTRGHRGREMGGWFPMDICPHYGGSAPGKGQGGRLRGRSLSPCPAPSCPGCRRRRGPGAPARRCPGSPAGLQECNQSRLCR